VGDLSLNVQLFFMSARTPENVIGRNNIDRIAKDTMGEYLSKTFRRYELLQDKLPKKYDVKSAYYALLSENLNDAYGFELGGKGPLRPDQVSDLHMASKFDEKVSDYAESILDIKHSAAAQHAKKMAGMTGEEKLQAAQKESIRNAAPPKKERKRGKANTKINRYRYI